MPNVLAPAKINLRLRIFAPDATGYHPLDTLFCAISLCDEIAVDLGGSGIVLEVQNADLGSPERNLAYRAANEFFQLTGFPANVRLTLKKRIPAGAGLGGGSSDAAAVLRTLNELHGNPVPQTELLATGARLGSDVAFFLCGSSLAQGSGYGEILEGRPALPRAPLLLLAPSFAVATPAAYGWLDAARAWSKDRDETPVTSWDDVARSAVNDFEAVLFERHPELRTLRDALRAQGARVAMVSGSGSVVFGVFADEAARSVAAVKLRELPGVQLIESWTLA